MGMRDIIVHHYFDVDAEQIFNTLKEDIPGLKNVLEKMKNDLFDTIRTKWLSKRLTCNPMKY